MWTKLNLSAPLEETQMTSEFLQSMASYDKYKELVDDLVNKLESVVQQNETIPEVTFICLKH